MKKRTGKMISLSLAVAMAVTAAPVTALADENTQSNVIETSELTPAQSAGETETDTTTVDTKEEEGTAWAALTSAEKVEEEAMNALPEVTETEKTVQGEGTKENPYKISTEAELKEAVKSDGYLQISDNIEIENTLVIENDVKLDLNGKTLTCSSEEIGIQVKSGSTFIEDSADNGKITTSNMSTILVKVSAGAEFTLNSGTLENTYFYWGFIRTGGLALRWYRDNVCNEAGNGAYFDELNEKAQNVPCGSKGVLFLPYLTGGFGETSNASACFLNMTMDTDQGVQWRAVLEAIGYDYISVTDIYKKAGVPLEFMTITEGGSNSEVWNQIKADMLGCKSATLENAQGAVLTDAVIAAYAVGDLEDPSQVFEKTRKIKKIYEPDPIRTKYYRSIYEQQRKLIKDDMAAVFETLHQISKIQEQSND